MTQTAQASVTVNLSDAVKNAQKESKDTTSEKDLQDKINKGLKEMAKTHKGAKDLFNSGQTIKDYLLSAKLLAKEA